MPSDRDRQRLGMVTSSTVSVHGVIRRGFAFFPAARSKILGGNLAGIVFTTCSNNRGLSVVTDGYIITEDFTVWK